MTLSKVIRMNAFRNLMDKLALRPDIIERTYVPIKNRDMTKLLEFSETIDRSSAVQFAIQYTIDCFEQSLEVIVEKAQDVSSSSFAEKLEKMRYAEQEAHDASNELNDVWEAKMTEKCPYCGEMIGGLRRSVKCKCGKTVLSGLLLEGFGFISGG